ncbi:MAG: flagellar M-ring protein FliF [Rhodocyclales bacterium]|nr:flagellar M-ring protein FliF [Rhodocyclales bacterium]
MIEQLKERWGQVSSGGRIGLVVGMVTIVGLLVFGTVWVLRDDYQILFSELNAQDASAMVAELDRMKVPYRLAEGGTAILVDGESVYKTRLKLMSKGMNLQGAVGFEIFNNADFGMTEFAQKVNYQRALQGELARTIMGFDEVKFARVHLVLPESGLFKRQNAKPKASISLVMRGNNRLAPDQISGIQRLVAASVPEIDASAVTIVDQHGVAVSKAIADEGSAGVAGKLEAKRQIEEYLTRKLVSVLDRAVGPGRAIVTVDVSLAYDQVKVTREDVLPLANTYGQNVGAISRRRESVQGSDAYADQVFSAGGINSSGRSGQATTPAASTSEVEFVNGRRVEQVVSLPGTVRRLSVGVMVPDVSDPVELAKLKEVVTMAAGISTARGDAIVVYSQPASGASDKATAEDGGFVAPDEGQSAPARTGQKHWPANLSMLLLLAGVLLGVATAAVYRRLRSSNRAPAQEKTLSAAERARLLDEISRWASAERT